MKGPYKAGPGAGLSSRLRRFCSVLPCKPWPGVLRIWLSRGKGDEGRPWRPALPEVKHMLEEAGAVLFRWQAKEVACDKLFRLLDSVSQLKFGKPACHLPGHGCFLNVPLFFRHVSFCASFAGASSSGRRELEAFPPSGATHPVGTSGVSLGAIRRPRAHEQRPQDAGALD